MHDHDTIAAPATATGNGGISIVRMSGDSSESILKRVFRPSGHCEYISNMLYYGHAVYEDEVLDECMAVIMRAPRSYTREDVCELHLHGGEQTVSSVMEALCKCGARPAEPGEFTKRAFLNGRIDLSRAEAVMSLISAQSKASARAALHQLDGKTGTFIKSVQNDILNLLSSIEAAIDYPDEIDEVETLDSVISECKRLINMILSSCDERSAKALESGLDVVICGCPNAGKSSLLNYLLEDDRAIVTAIPGTTRDIVKDYTVIGGIKVNLSDTAGIHETSDPVEMIGVDRAKKAAEKANLVLLLIDSTNADAPDNISLKEMVSGVPHIIVYSKTDLLENENRVYDDGIGISVKTGAGINTLKEKILSFAGHFDEVAITSVRHTQLALKASDELENAIQTAARAGSLDLCAIDLHCALDTISEITGDRVDEKLLDTIFSKFCVGK
ncbi:MAG: tRNA uridine-5-carboxymethylaminomethyl(34) synthesis GTPase MnmE [Clostridiales bacterium]|nr:tRNA uridine-5-carboxymethylaminomethyl(34) synthesis GTPase MnmE [Clostridiales bacterium]